MKKLTSLGYIDTIADDTDKRVRHIYLHDSVLPVVEAIKALHKEFYQDLTKGME